MQLYRPIVAPVTQEFNNPVNHHPGTDWSNGRFGDPIYSPTDCVCSFAGPSDGFGSNTVCLYSARYNVTFTFGHAQRRFVNTNDKVPGGMKIAEVGSQGNSTGPHLHGEIRLGHAEFGNVFNGNFDLNAWLYTGNASAYSGNPYSNPNPLTVGQRLQIGALQKTIGVKVDMAWGASTQSKLDEIRFLNMIRPNWPTPKPNAQVQALQKLFGCKSTNGAWGTETEQAYQWWHYCFYAK